MQGTASSTKQKEAEDKLAGTIASIVGVPRHTVRQSELYLDRVQKYRPISFKYRLKRLIPGTHDFKRRRQKGFLRQASNRAILFASLKSLTPEQKNSLFRKFLKAQHRLVAVELLENKVRENLKIVTSVLGAFILFAITPLSVWHWYHFNLFKPVAFVIYFALVTIVMQLGTMSVSIIPNLNVTPATSKLLAVSLLIIWPGTIFILSHKILDLLSRAHSEVHPSLHYGIIGAIYGLTMIWSLVIIAVALVAVALQTLSSRKYRLHPEAVVTDRMFRALFELDQNKSRDLSSHEVKSRMMDLIETTAVAIEVGMVTGCRMGDQATTIWFADRMARIAGAVRDLKKWVLTPKPDTRFHLQRKLADLLVQVIDGRWDDMPFQPDASARKNQLRAKLTALGVSLALAAFLIFLAAQHWITPISAYGFLTFVPWFLLIIFALFDPDRLKTLKDVIEIFSASKKL